MTSWRRHVTATEYHWSVAVKRAGMDHVCATPAGVVLLAAAQVQLHRLTLTSRAFHNDQLGTSRWAGRIDAGSPAFEWL
jgi:hypothetical protein